jgi:hypothetical protein
MQQVARHFASGEISSLASPVQVIDPAQIFFIGNDDQAALAAQSSLSQRDTHQRPCFPL